MAGPEGVGREGLLTGSLQTAASTIRMNPLFEAGSPEVKNNSSRNCNRDQSNREHFSSCGEVRGSCRERHVRDVRRVPNGTFRTLNVPNGTFETPVMSRTCRSGHEGTALPHSLPTNTSKPG